MGNLRPNASCCDYLRVALDLSGGRAGHTFFCSRAPSGVPYPFATMEFKIGLTRTGALDAEATRRQAEQSGYTTFMLPEKGIVDRVSFFEAVRTTLPLDPPLVGSRSWDALSDSLWEGLYSHPA